MALVNAATFVTLRPTITKSLASLLNYHPTREIALTSTTSRTISTRALKNNISSSNISETSLSNEKAQGHLTKSEKSSDDSTSVVYYSFSPYGLMLLLGALVPGAQTVTSLFSPIIELVKSWNLPDWLVHWGHPGNMAVVLFAMGGYGTYLGFRIRFSDDVEEKAKAKDLHPKLLGGMFFFFALGATGGITSLLTSDKPIFESPHAVTGLIGLALLTLQTILPALFEGNPGLRSVHGILGSGIMTLFLLHAALGLQLGLSY